MPPKKKKTRWSPRVKTRVRKMEWTRSDMETIECLWKLKMPPADIVFYLSTAGGRRKSATAVGSMILSTASYGTCGVVLVTPLEIFQKAGTVMVGGQEWTFTDASLVMHLYATHPFNAICKFLSSERTDTEVYECWKIMAAAEEGEGGGGKTAMV